MKRNIFVCEMPLVGKDVEIVERKGIGHPDTLIDGIMEEVSIGLSKEYRKEFGAIQHHNVDKGLICGGETIPDFGGGKVIRPIEVLLAGRATTLSNGREKKVAIEAAKNFLSKSVRHLDVNDSKQIVFLEPKFSKGSSDLRDVFDRAAKGIIPSSNDTSFGIGFAPFTKLEGTVIGIERFLNFELNKKFPAIGEDIKVMGSMEHEKIRITVAMAVVSKYISSLSDYIEFKKKVSEEILHKYPGIELYLNTADRIEKDPSKSSVYITITGLSMEMGDDGSVGRGNRPNGLITPSRPMTLEAAAGKNPVNHVGKIYSVTANEIAKEIAKLNGIINCEVYLLSQIGKPIDQPKSASIELRFASGIADSEKLRLKEEANKVTDNYLANIGQMTEKILNKRAGVYY